MRSAARLLSMIAAVIVLALQPGSARAAEPANQRGQDLILGSWALYTSRFLSPEGRIVDDGNGNISHSEGQGYGLVMAAAADDRASFDAILKWTDDNLYVRGDGLAAWQWKPDADPKVADTNNATDGDLLIAWGLLRASREWNVPQYRERARTIADTVARTLVASSPYGNVLLPGAAGFSAGDQPDGPVVNLSYWVFPAIEELQAISPALAEAKLVESGHKLAAEARFGRLGLPADWTALGGGRAEPARNFPATYGFNALRVPLYLAWSHTLRDDLLQPYAEALTDWKGVPQIVDLDTGFSVQPLVDSGYYAMADVLACSLGRIEAARMVQSFVPTTYYASTLHILSIIALTERFPKCL